MADDDPELEAHLEDLKSGKYAKVKVTYKDLKSGGQTDHRVGWSRLADDWLSRSFNNRLELTWRSVPRDILDEDSNPFPVKPKAVPSATGDVTLEWKVWAKTSEVSSGHRYDRIELYSVMRAEEYFIEKKDCRKLASKYYCDAHGPTENTGLDSFFKSESGGKYVVCESKFTSKEGDFTTWMSKGPAGKEDWICTYKLKKYGGLIPMSWPWINSRVKRAVRKPPIQLVERTPAQKARIRAEIREMKRACQDKDNVDRYVNFYGLEEVPIYPGRYRFKCAERTKLSKNILHLKWKLEVKAGEFIKLGDRFDKEWVEPNT
jgi:hypothetical protein